MLYDIKREVAAVGLLISMLLFNVVSLGELIGGVRRKREPHDYGERILLGALFLFLICTVLLVD